MARNLENWALDNCFAFRGERSGDAKIVIVAFDDESLKRLDKPLMFLSPELAAVVVYLREQGAAAIGLDVFLPDGHSDYKDLRPGGIGDAETMGKAISKSNEEIRRQFPERESSVIVLPEFGLPAQKATVGNAEADATAAAEVDFMLPTTVWHPVDLPHAMGDSWWNDFGFVNLTPDLDMFVRRQRLRAADFENVPHASLALAVYGAAHGLADEWFTQSALVLDDRPLPLDADGALLINYRGPAGTIDRVPFHEVLAAAGRKCTGDEKSEPDVWKGAIVLIGSTADLVPDRHATPFINQSLLPFVANAWSQNRPQLMPGVEIHANTIATLADRRFITTPWWLSTPLLLIIVGVGLGIMLVRVSLEMGFLVTFIHHWLWKIVCILAFSWWGWRVEMMSMLLLGFLAYGAVFAMRWRWIRRMMGMVKSEAVARALEADPGTLDLQGEYREITVLFSDIRNFTKFSDKREPQEVVAQLNEYFGVVVPTIEKHGGIVNQYIGDGLMVIFGAPDRQTDHAVRAVRAAVEMVQQIHEQQNLWSQRGWRELDPPQDFHIGVGIHTGPVVVGTIGSRNRLDYTAIGDTVNTASRIESGNKDLGTEILISRETLSTLPPGDRLLALVGGAQSLDVKGKPEPVIVHEVSVPSVLAESGSAALSNFS